MDVMASNILMTRIDNVGTWTGWGDSDSAVKANLIVVANDEPMEGQ